MTALSIVIVNYNVKYFLAQCLNSILHSDLSDISLEIIVVDNASTDDSFPYLEDRFGKEVLFIRNSENVGFARACNQGIANSSGDIILFLNPDTLLSKQTLEASVKRLIIEDTLGALGVRMVDGKGSFLPESKRSFPTPWNALLKLTGLDKTALKWGAPYNLNHLNQYEDHYIDVLCGAYFMVKKQVLNTVGGFDEDFFMYGEDIDLSLRIKKAGYEILYFSGTTIIHFKGESHGEKGIKYYSRFYNAMSVYARKHHSSFLALFLKLSIFVAGGLAIIKAYAKKWGGIIFDSFVLLLLFILIKHLWATYFYNDPDYYPTWIIYVIMGYVCVVVFSYLGAGHYKSGASLRNTLSGWLFGGALIFSTYALAPLELRFSRILIVVFSLVSLLIPLVTRMLFAHWSWIKGNYLLIKKKIDAIIISEIASYENILQILNNSDTDIRVIGRVGKEPDNFKFASDYLGLIDQLDNLIDIYLPDQIIFNLDDGTTDLLFMTLKSYGGALQVFGYSNNSLSIIGSQNSSQASQVYTMQFSFKINNISSRILKKTFDSVASVVILIMTPLLLFIRFSLIQDAVKVIIGNRTWVGYSQDDAKMNQLPVLKDGIIDCAVATSDPEVIHFANLNYARNYSLFTDIEMLIRYIWTGK